MVDNKRFTLNALVSSTSTYFFGTIIVTLTNIIDHLPDGPQVANILGSA